MKVRRAGDFEVEEGDDLVEKEAFQHPFVNLAVSTRGIDELALLE